MDLKGKTDPAMKAKMDVIQALRKMAMELMTDSHGDMGDDAVIAKLDVQKMPKDYAMDMLGDELCESDEHETDEKSQDELADSDEADEQMEYDSEPQIGNSKGLKAEMLKRMMSKGKY